MRKPRRSDFVGNNMTEIAINDFMPEHLRGISDVFATDGKEKIRVGRSRLVRCVSRETPGELRKTLSIRVKSIDEKTIRLLESSISEFRSSME